MKFIVHIECGEGVLGQHTKSEIVAILRTLAGRLDERLMPKRSLRLSDRTGTWVGWAHFLPEIEDDDDYNDRNDGGATVTSIGVDL